MKRSHDKSGLSVYLLFCILSGGKGEPANLARERYIKKKKKKNTGSERVEREKGRREDVKEKVKEKYFFKDFYEI